MTMLAQLPSALEAFDDAGSVFLPPDPNADHDDDDDSFASQDTLLEDARTKHKRLARQRMEAAYRDAKPVKTMPLSKPIVVKTPKKVQPPTPSAIGGWPPDAVRLLLWLRLRFTLGWPPAAVSHTQPPSA